MATAHPFANAGLGQFGRDVSFSAGTGSGGGGKDSPLSMLLGKLLGGEDKRAEDLTNPASYMGKTVPPVPGSAPSPQMGGMQATQPTPAISQTVDTQTPTTPVESTTYDLTQAPAYSRFLFPTK